MRREANSNISPGGGVRIGPWGDNNTAISLSVDNLYSYEPGVPDRASIRNIRNTLEVTIGANADVDDDREDRVLRGAVPITRQECYDIALAFLSIAQADRNWEGIECRDE